jgi:hypothetical protein
MAKKIREFLLYRRSRFTEDVTPSFCTTAGRIRATVVQIRVFNNQGSFFFNALGSQARMKRVSSLFVRSPAAQRGLGHGVKVPRAPRAARPMSGGPGEKTRLWDRYQAVLLRGGAPAVLVKSLTASVIAGGGDIACQMLIEGKSFTGASVRSPAANAEPATKEGGAAVQGEEHRGTTRQIRTINLARSRGVVAPAADAPALFASAVSV